MGSYCDVIGVRSFARFHDKAEDYEERVLEQFIRYSGRPVFSMEAATRHPLQSFADLITIEEYKTTERPKVVMTWAPHPNALPQAVPNSFAEWMNAAGYDFVITHPEGYELARSSSATPVSNTTSARRSKGRISSMPRTGGLRRPPITERCSAATGAGRWTPKKMALTHDAYFMHCLPVRRNMIVTDEVIVSLPARSQALNPPNTTAQHNSKRLEKVEGRGNHGRKHGRGNASTTPRPCRLPRGLRLLPGRRSSSTEAASSPRASPRNSNCRCRWSTGAASPTRARSTS